MVLVRAYGATAIVGRHDRRSDQADTPKLGGAAFLLRTASYAFRTGAEVTWILPRFVSGRLGQRKTNRRFLNEHSLAHPDNDASSR